jgi:GNAT superfamily N-acetyltransferase
VTLKIERVVDAARADDWHAVGVATFAVDHPDLLEDPVEEVLAQLPDGTPSWRREFYVGYLGDVPVARASLGLPTLDNRELAILKIQVVPDRRRRGFGRAMFEQLRERATDAGRSVLIGDASGPLEGGDSPGDAFASALGAKEALRSTRRTLDLVALDRDHLERLEAEARGRAEGYELVGWIDRAPEELVEGVASLIARMVTDSPMGELKIGQELWDGERIRELEDETVRMGRVRLALGARASTDGSLVAMTEIGVSRHRPEIAYQWDTIVAPEHRGHRLGQWVKAANLLRLVDVTPGATRIMTWNADANAFMIEVNERLGFRPVGRQSEWQLELETTRVGDD